MLSQNNQYTATYTDLIPTSFPARLCHIRSIFLIIATQRNELSFKNNAVMSERQISRIEHLPSTENDGLQPHSADLNTFRGPQLLNSAIVDLKSRLSSQKIPHLSNIFHGPDGFGTASESTSL